MMLISNIIYTLLLMSSCQSTDPLNKYVNHSAVVANQAVVHPNNSFSISIPTALEWNTTLEDSSYYTEILSATSQPKDDGFSDILEIKKVKGFENILTLETLFNTLVENLNKDDKYTILKDSGNTQILNKPAYFINTYSHTEIFGNVEVITIITNSKESGYFYFLTAVTRQSSHFLKDMAILIKSLASFKTL